MLVNGSTGARTSPMTLAERTRMNTDAETARTAMARAFQLCATSARMATIPPAPTPATKPVTASHEARDGGDDEDREDQGLGRRRGSPQMFGESSAVQRESLLDANREPTSPGTQHERNEMTFRAEGR